MNSWALIAFALWALFMRYLPQILEFLKIKKFASTLPGPSLSELIENVKKGRKLLKFFYNPKISFQTICFCRNSHVAK